MYNKNDFQYLTLALLNEVIHIVHLDGSRLVSIILSAEETALIHKKMEITRYFAGKSADILS